MSKRERSNSVSSVSSVSSSLSSSSNKVQSLLSKTKRRRGHVYDISKEDEEGLDVLVKAMDEACAQDIEANTQGLPALKKMMILKKVVNTLKVEKLQDLFLDMNGCLVLTRWLSPLPDGCLPHTRILSDILTVLKDIPVSTEHLEAFSLGKAVMRIAEGADDLQVRKLAHWLVDKWSRQIYEINTNWSSLDMDTLDHEPEDRPSEPNLHKLIQTDYHTGQVRIPAKNQFDFKYRPASKIKDLCERGETVLPKFLCRRVRSHARKLNGRMSADGRGLLG